VLAWIGWQALITGTFLAFILASAYGIALIMTRGANRGSQLPLALHARRRARGDRASACVGDQVLLNNRPAT